MILKTIEIIKMKHMFLKELLKVSVVIMLSSISAVWVFRVSPQVNIWFSIYPKELEKRLLITEEIMLGSSR